MLANVLSPYKYLYYRLYSWDFRIGGESWSPEFYALTQISVLIFLNVISLLEAVELYVGRHTVLSNLYGWFGVLLSLGTAGYFLVVYRGKYRTIATEFIGETPAQKTRRLVGIVVYVALTLLGFFWLTFENTAHLGPVPR